MLNITHYQRNANQDHNEVPLHKLQIELPYDPAIPLLGIHTEETRIVRDTCTPVFIAALSIIARTWKQPRCPSAVECIRKLWYIYTMEYYSAIKKNTFESVLMRCIHSEPLNVTYLEKGLCTLPVLRRQWQPTPVLFPGKPHGRRSLVGCCLWGRTESDTTDVT